jgi:vesicle-associated membrane protein 7
MCLREKNYPSKAAFLFLEDIKDRFFQLFSEIDYRTAIPNGLNARFRETLKNRMEYFRKNYDQEDKLGELRKTLNESRNEIMQTDDALSVRSEKITLIVNKAENIKTESKSYYSWVFKILFDLL